ncbi:hypothetical protein BH10PSE19_BH10PSE19_17620 [soil metagenome]
MAFDFSKDSPVMWLDKYYSAIRTTAKEQDDELVEPTDPPTTPQSQLADIENRLVPAIEKTTSTFVDGGTLGGTMPKDKYLQQVKGSIVAVSAALNSPQVLSKKQPIKATGGEKLAAVLFVANFLMLAWELVSLLVPQIALFKGFFDPLLLNPLKDWLPLLESPLNPLTVMAGQSLLLAPLAYFSGHAFKLFPPLRWAFEKIESFIQSRPTLMAIRKTLRHPIVAGLLSTLFYAGVAALCFFFFQPALLSIIGLWANSMSSIYQEYKNPSRPPETPPSRASKASVASGEVKVDDSTSAVKTASTLELITGAFSHNKSEPHKSPHFEELQARLLDEKVASMIVHQLAAQYSEGLGLGNEYKFIVDVFTLGANVAPIATAVQRAKNSTDTVKQLANIRSLAKAVIGLNNPSITAAWTPLYEDITSLLLASADKPAAELVNLQKRLSIRGAVGSHTPDMEYKGLVAEDEAANITTHAQLNLIDDVLSLAQVVSASVAAGDEQSSAVERVVRLCTGALPVATGALSAPVSSELRLLDAIIAKNIVKVKESLDAEEDKKQIEQLQTLASVVLKHSAAGRLSSAARASWESLRSAGLTIDVRATPAPQGALHSPRLSLSPTPTSPRANLGRLDDNRAMNAVLQGILAYQAADGKAVEAPEFQPLQAKILGRELAPSSSSSGYIDPTPHIIQLAAIAKDEKDHKTERDSPNTSNKLRLLVDLFTPAGLGDAKALAERVKAIHVSYKQRNADHRRRVDAGEVEADRPAKLLAEENIESLATAICCKHNGVLSAEGGAEALAIWRSIAGITVQAEAKIERQGGEAKAVEGAVGIADELAAPRSPLPPGSPPSHRHSGGSASGVLGSGAGQPGTFSSILSPHTPPRTHGSHVMASPDAVRFIVDPHIPVLHPSPAPHGASDGGSAVGDDHKVVMDASAYSSPLRAGNSSTHTTPGPTAGSSSTHDTPERPGSSSTHSTPVHMPTLPIGTLYGPPPTVVISGAGGGTGLSSQPLPLTPTPFQAV